MANTRPTRLSDFSDDSDGSSYEATLKVIENEIGFDKDEEEDDEDEEETVLSEIDLDSWTITPPHDRLSFNDEYGIVYDRYSSDNQNETGCVARVKSMLDLAEEKDIPLIRDPIVDEAESGKDADRWGLKKVVRYAQHPRIEYLFIHDVDRLARWNSLSIFLIDLFARKFSIKIITSDGVLDLDRLEGLAMTWVSSMSAEIENRNKAQNTLSGQIEKFKQGSYTTWYGEDNIRLGYKDSEDELLEIDSDELEAAKAIFRTADQIGFERPYAEIREKMQSRFGSDLDVELTNYRIKSILTDPLYIGQPTVKGESIGDQGQEAVLDKPDLQIIDEDLFKRVNRKVEKIQEKYSRPSQPADVMDLDHLLFEFGPLPVIESSTDVAVLCPECETKMVRDGSREVDHLEELVPIYVCPECDADSEESGSYKTFPNTWEYYKMRLFDMCANNVEEVAKYFGSNEI